MEILKFVTVDENDKEGESEYATRDEAIAVAAKSGHAVLMRTYTLDDTELVWTPDGENSWPPNHAESD